MTKREKLHALLNNFAMNGGFEETEENIWQLFKTKEVPDYDEQVRKDMGAIVEVFSQVIHPIRVLNDKAKVNILKVLKTFNVAECIRAIDNFSKDEWNMKNNGHRSLDWFFDKPSRIETYLNMKSKEVEGETVKIGDKLYYSEQELKEAEQKGEIYYDNRKNQFVPSGKKA